MGEEGIGNGQKINPKWKGQESLVPKERKCDRGIFEGRKLRRKRHCQEERRALFLGNSNRGNG
jgi:hypothetical protein